VQSFEQFIRENKNEITALQILYSRPYRQRLTLKQIDELAMASSTRTWSWSIATAALNTHCAKFGCSIAPAELRRIGFERVECPKCGERFIPKGQYVQPPD
jgi:hypothetical protein